MTDRYGQHTIKGHDVVGVWKGGYLVRPYRAYIARYDAATGDIRPQGRWESIVDIAYRLFSDAAPKGSHFDIWGVFENKKTGVFEVRRSSDLGRALDCPPDLFEFAMWVYDKRPHAAVAAAAWNVQKELSDNS